MKLHGFGVALTSLFVSFALLAQTVFFIPNALDHSEMIPEVRKTLCPDFPDSVMHGPEDAIYYPLTQAQIDDLLRFYNDRREVFPYVVDAFDCDDMAREFHHLSRVWHLRRMGLVPVTPAVGSAYVHIHGPYDLVSGSPAVEAYHVIIAILRDDGQWFFFEPQTNRIIPIEGPVLYERSLTVMKIQI